MHRDPELTQRAYVIHALFSRSYLCSLTRNPTPRKHSTRPLFFLSLQGASATRRKSSGNVTIELTRIYLQLHNWDLNSVLTHLATVPECISLASSGAHFSANRLILGLPFHPLVSRPPLGIVLRLAARSCSNNELTLKSFSTTSQSLCVVFPRIFGRAPLLAGTLIKLTMSRLWVIEF